MTWLIENWYLLIALVAMFIISTIVVITYFKLPTSKQMEKVRQWLLYAVIHAEKELGSKTGRLKLSLVYDMFVARFSWLSKIISFETFSRLVDEALEEMRHLLETNKRVKELVLGEESE